MLPAAAARCNAVFPSCIVEFELHTEWIAIEGKRARTHATEDGSGDSIAVVTYQVRGDLRVCLLFAAKCLCACLTSPRDG